MKLGLIFMAALALAPIKASAEAVPYALDAAHSQVVFSYDHNGYSTTYGMFSGFEGTIMFDAESPEKSSVSVSVPVKSLFTGWEKRFAHFMSDAFFGATDADLVTFKSTSIKVMGDNAAIITGDLTLNDITKSVELDAKLNLTGVNSKRDTAWAGFDATTTLVRSEFGLGLAAPSVSDEVELLISIEAGAVK